MNTFKDMNTSITEENTFCWTEFKLKGENGETFSELIVRTESSIDKAYYIVKHKDKNVLYLGNFITNEKYRNKGYGRQLIEYVINKYKGKYDILHLNACPYHFVTVQGGVKPIYIEPYNGLPIDRLVEFYKSLGLQTVKTINELNHQEIVMIMSL